MKALYQLHCPAQSSSCLLTSLGCLGRLSWFLAAVSRLRPPRTSSAVSLHFVAFIQHPAGLLHMSATCCQPATYLFYMASAIAPALFKGRQACMCAFVFAPLLWRGYTLPAHRSGWHGGMVADGQPSFSSLVPLRYTLGHYAAFIQASLPQNPALLISIMIVIQSSINNKERKTQTEKREKPKQIHNEKIKK